MKDLAQKISPCFFLCGNDDYLVDRQARKLYDKHGAGLVDDFSREIIDAEAQNVGKVELIIKRFTESVQTPSIFGGNKVVWLRGANFLEESTLGKSEGAKAQVEQLTQVLELFKDDTVCVILSAYPVDKRTKGFKALKTVAGSQFQLVGDEAGLETLTQIALEESKSLGVTLHREAIDALISKVDGNSRLLIQEIQKLATFIGKSSEPINTQLVNEMVAQAGEDDFFEFADAFFSLNLDRTLDALTRHFLVNKESRSLITSLFNKLRLLIQLRVLLDAKSIDFPSFGGLNKNTLQQLAAQYNLPFGDPDNKSAYNVFTQHPWYLSKLATTAKKIPLKKLIDFDLAFIAAFEEILDQSQPHEQEAVMRRLIINCLK